MIKKFSRVFTRDRKKQTDKKKSFVWVQKTKKEKQPGKRKLKRPPKVLKRGKCGQQILRSPITTGVLSAFLFLILSYTLIIEPLDAQQSAVRQVVQATTAPRSVEVVLPVTNAQAVNASPRLYAETAEELLKENEGRVAEVFPRVYTSARATALTFSGIGSLSETEMLVSVLRSKSAVGTFFISMPELETALEQITQIVRGGQRIGILVLPEQMTDVRNLMCDLLETKARLETTYGYNGDYVLRQSYGVPTDMLCECASALDWPVVTETVNATPETLRSEYDILKIIANVLPDDGALQRGGIAHFEMNFFGNNDRMLPEYIRQLMDTRNPYPVVPVTDILRNRQYRYTYPVPGNAVLSELQNAIYPGHTTYLNVFEKIKNGYIGNPRISKESLMPGFSYLERDALDKIGMVRNERQQVFLTFSGWGNDVIIDSILQVLEKHRATATFFIETGKVAENPNLVRAIAEAGHTIGSSTHNHFSLGIELDKGERYVELNDDENYALMQDILTSMTTLEAICGDVRLTNAKPALSTYFRPPDLAISRLGLGTVFDLGFTYCIFGSYDAEDEKAKDAISLANELRLETRSGAILMLHMTNESLYTPEALDIYLNRLELEKSYQFVRLSDALK